MRRGKATAPTVLRSPDCLAKPRRHVRPSFSTAWPQIPASSTNSLLVLQTFNLSLKDIVFDDTKGTYPHPNTMRGVLMAGKEKLYEMEYYSVGGGFIEWKGYKPPDKGQPKYPYSTMKELMRHVVDNKIPLSKVMLVNEMAISGKSEKQVWDFIDQVTEVMLGMVNTGLKAEGVLPGPIKLQSKAATVFKRAQSSNSKRIVQSRRYLLPHWPPRRKMRAGTSS